MIRPIFLWCLLSIFQVAGAQEAEHPWLMMVSTKSTDTHRDAQFNEWYNQIDIPDVLQVPGYKRARRGLRIDVPQLPRADLADDNTYVALYDILSPNIDRTMVDMLMASRKMEATGRSTDLLKVTERLYFRQMAPASEAAAPQRAGKKQFLLLERVDCCRDEATAAQLNDWYSMRHIPDMLRIPGFVRATRYELYRVLMIEPRSAPRFLTVYEVNADSAEQVANLRESELRKLRQGGRSSDSFVEHGTALYLGIKDVYAH
ncbi:MAG: hypothetical protein JSR66_26660 [Proteobacteria bacterium]|nr:hypothetical protein [Pseudomonadota bacterium]